MESIQIILNDHTPVLEPEVLEYLESLIANAIENEEDSDAVMSTLQEFLTPEECDAILSAYPNTENKVQETGMPATVEPTLISSSLAKTEPKLSNHPDPKVEDGKNTNNSPKTTTAKKKEKRKQRRLQKRQKEETPESPTEKTEGSDMIDDHASAWQDRQSEGRLWGGRGHGGRGVRYTGDNLQSIHLPSVSLQFQGNELLVDSPMDILQGHRYGLVGRNGVGKSTLLRQLAAGAIPGIPQSMRILLVQQQVQGRTDQTTLEALVEADIDRLLLLEEQESIEKNLEAGIDLEQNAERLGDVVAELDAIDADSAQDRALEILKGLSYTDNMIYGPTASLSGGWRMRLAIAQALFVRHSDLILLDECTNHLDLHGMEWLIQYLTQKSNHTLMIVSHDRSFLDNVCTDIVVMEHQRLTYHVGNYSEYQRQVQEKATREAQILDASERQRSKAMAFVQKHQNNKKSTDPNKQRQAKMIKEKKLDRIGMYREDGKRYKNMSLKKLSEDSLRLAQKVHIERDDPTLRLKFPNPTFPPGLALEHSPIVRMENFNFGYSKDAPFLLRDVTLHLTRGSKVAVVGKNGCGKTTLVKLIKGELEKTGKSEGEIWRHPNLRMGHISQYSVEELEAFHSMTVVEYAEEKLKSGIASSRVIAEASGNVRQYLGAFGLGGSHAHRGIGTLSGGERMRLCFATVLADEPHLLLMDESTNHIDLETLDSMSEALRAYAGAVLMVSHNQGFLSGFCKELWVVEDGEVHISHDDTATFDELFSDYRSHIMSGSSARSRTEQRQAKAGMARRAAKQNANSRGQTTLLA
eukprot:scaffold1469_cov119-Cylindrotheca_fusiformis.AAC.10